jgi:hypothetical protein
MATADVLQPTATPAAPQIQPLKAEKKLQKHNVETTLFYFPNDGSTPDPTYVGYVRSKLVQLREQQLTTLMKEAGDLSSTN